MKIYYDPAFMIYVLVCVLLLWAVHGDISDFQGDFWSCRCSDNKGFTDYEGIKLNSTEEVVRLLQNKNTSMCLLWNLD